MNAEQNTNKKETFKVALICVAIAVACVVFSYVFIRSNNEPISRAEAIAYSGLFERYESADNDCSIHFADGSEYAVYPHTETWEFYEQMNALPKGTKLHLLINPNSDYVVEIRTDSEELLNFEASQEAIDSYDDGYAIIGIFFSIAGAVLILCVIGFYKSRRMEAARDIERERETVGGTVDSKILRRADTQAKCRILLEKQMEGYHICYRRVRSVNELVINGYVYDEKKAIIEFPHKLYAIVDGHRIEAGYDDESYSYILFDCELVARKMRIV